MGLSRDTWVTVWVAAMLGVIVLAVTMLIAAAAFGDAGHHDAQHLWFRAGLASLWLVAMIFLIGLFALWLAARHQSGASLAPETQSIIPNPDPQPMTALELVKPPNDRTPKAAAPERDIIDVDPEYLRALHNEHTGIQADRLTEPYLGKWIQVSGQLGDVQGTSPGNYQVTFERKGPTTTLYMYFRGGPSLDRLPLLRRGDQLSVLGRIANVSNSWVDLEDCELIVSAISST